MRTMVLEYRNLNDWAILGLNAGIHIPATWFAYGIDAVTCVTVGNEFDAGPGRRRGAGAFLIPPSTWIALRP